MAGPLTQRPRAVGWRALLAIALLVLLAHAIALLWFQRLLQAPSLLKAMAPPFYTRTITPQSAEPPPPAAPPVEAAKLESHRPSAVIRQARTTPNKRAPKRSTPPEPTPELARAPEGAASAAAPAERPDAATRLASAPPPDAPTPAASAAPFGPGAAAELQPPAQAASAAEPAYLKSWPGDTRLTYQLGGNYRGELHGSARVLWQREGTRYHTAVEMNAGLLAALSFTSQGHITEGGLMPEVYEEELRGRRRGVRLEAETVQLNKGERIDRPAGVQDTASQFVELGHRFASGQIKLQPGAQVRFALARPGGIDDWVYDVIGEETLHLPRLGAVAAWHLKPRRLDKPRGPITAEIWFAPTLQYLPVRIRISLNQDTYVDLLVDTVEQR